MRCSKQQKLLLERLSHFQLSKFYLELALVDWWHESHSSQTMHWYLDGLVCGLQRIPITNYLMFNLHRMSSYWCSGQSRLTWAQGKTIEVCQASKMAEMSSPPDFTRTDNIRQYLWSSTGDTSWTSLLKSWNGHEDIDRL